MSAEGDATEVSGESDEDEFLSHYGLEHVKETLDEPPSLIIRAQVAEIVISSDEEELESMDEDLSKSAKETEYEESYEYLFCDECSEIHHGDCPTHGPLQLLDESERQDQDSLDHTPLPVPSSLTVKPSSIPGAGLGVFATELVSKRVRVGPCELDCASSPTHSNWTKFINCARNSEEQNLVAFRYEKAIYYRTVKSIEPGAELLVWYGEQYSSCLGMRSTSEEGQTSTHKCLGCGCEFVEEKSLQLHYSHSSYCAIANPEAVMCGKCHQKFPQLEGLQQHVRKHILRTSVEASIKPTDDKCGHGNKCWRCGLCDKCFDRRSSLRSHLKVHTGEKPYKCDECGRMFSQRGNLRTHRRLHTGVRPYKCERCGKSFNANAPLQAHVLTHMGVLPYKCNLCEKKYSTNNELQMHLRVHSGDRPYVCEFCGKKFIQCGHLHSHMRIHSGDRPYRCEICGKRFNQSSNLRVHRRIHSGEKPYKCDKCEHSFTTRTSLRRHIEVHNGPYPCEHCGKKFSLKEVLQEHVQAYCKGKQFKCEECDESFAFKTQLLKHRSATHPIVRGLKSHKCDICGKKYSQVKSLAKHREMCSRIKTTTTESETRFFTNVMHHPAHPFHPVHPAHPVHPGLPAPVMATVMKPVLTTVVRPVLTTIVNPVFMNPIPKTIYVVRAS